MSRLQKIIISGCAAVTIALVAHFIVAPPFKTGRLGSPGSAESRTRGYIGAAERTGGFAPVALWWEEPDGRWKARDTIRLNVLRGLTFHEGEIVRTEELTAYLDQLVSQKRGSFVLLTVQAESRWVELVPLIDACRRSNVSVVLLNHAPSRPNQSPQRNAGAGPAISDEASAHRPAASSEETARAQPPRRRASTFGTSHLDGGANSYIVVPMTLLAIKHQMKRLKSRELRELNAYLIRLRHSTPEWKRATAKKIRAVQAGRYVTAEALEERIARG